MSTDTFQLDVQRTKPGLDYLTWMQRAGATGKSLGSMLREITSLLFGPGKLQPAEYFLYQLYDDQRYTPAAKRTFMGGNAPTIPSAWAEIGNDKPALSAFLRGLDLPIPETQAIVHPTRTFGGAHTLRTPEEIKQFLRNDAVYPIFGKPFDSACSLGTANISGFDGAKDCLVLSNQQVVSLDNFIEEVEKFGWKYLLQTLMRPHPALVPIIGDRVSSVRMFVLSDNEGCELLRASWKIPATQNGADNFWRVGNILAGVDAETGAIGRTLRRTKDGTESTSKHPITNASFEDLVFPEWQAMRDCVLRAAPNLPGCHFQGWDVALTDRGPVLVELEGSGGDPIMEQLCFDSGLLQGRLLKFIHSQKASEKERKAKGKARRSSMVKRNFAALSAASAEAAADDEACGQSNSTRASITNDSEFAESNSTAAVASNTASIDQPASATEPLPLDASENKKVVNV